MLEPPEPREMRVGRTEGLRRDWGAQGKTEDWGLGGGLGGSRKWTGGVEFLAKAEGDLCGSWKDVGD